MSFARRGYPQHNKGKRIVRLKKAPAPKKEWVDTVNDLSVYKLTNAELNHRHEIHKSHNKAAAQWELKERALKRRFRHAGSPAPLDQASLSIIREVFSDQLLLKDVLARSDRALAVVKDLFGDAPHVHTGHPSVTMAPSVHQRLERATRLSLMNQQALNEVDDWEEEYSDEDSGSPACSDHHVIQRASLQKMTECSKRKLIQKEENKPKAEQIDREDIVATPSTEGTAPNHTALNATAVIQHVRPRQSRLVKEDPSCLLSQVLNPELTHNNSRKIQSQSSRTTTQCRSQSSELNGSSVTSVSEDQTTLRLLRDMLGQVEAELDTLSPDTVPAPRGQRTHAKQGLTEFSVALVSSLGRLVHLLKQRDEVILRETQGRKRLEKELKEQQGLINALTAEMMTLRDEVATLQVRLQQQTAQLEQKLDTVAMVTGGLGLMEIQDDTRQEPEFNLFGASTLNNCQPTPAGEREPQPVQSCLSSAVLLSPPRQGDNWQQIPVTHAAPPHQEHLSVGASRSCRDVQACSSASSLASLPLCSLPLSSLPLCSLPPTLSVSQTSDLSPEAMMAEIAKISRDNELIKAQLSRARDLGSAFGGAPDSEQRRQSTSTGTGRVMPQSVGERSTAVTGSAGRKNHQGQISKGELLLTQESSPNLSVNSVEQRLLDLNRRSAAARGRLLELIEQQKQNASSVVSPPASPMPASALSPQSAGGGRNPEVSMMLPEREFLSQKQTGIPDMSSQSFGQEGHGKTQMDRERAREGWFALSSHVR